MKLSPTWTWPAVISAASVAAALSFSYGRGTPIGIAALWAFMLVCPGFAFVRLLRVQEMTSQIALSIVLSVAIDTLVALVMLYGGLWSTSLGLSSVIVITLIGVTSQIVILEP